MNRAQLCLLRSVGKKGFPTYLLTVFLSRCGATQEDLDQLVSWGFVRVEELVPRDSRYVMTPAGKKAYRERPRNVYF